MIQGSLSDVKVSEEIRAKMCLEQRSKAPAWELTEQERVCEVASTSV